MLTLVAVGCLVVVRIHFAEVKALVAKMVTCVSVHAFAKVD